MKTVILLTTEYAKFQIVKRLIELTDLYDHDATSYINDVSSGFGN